MPINTGTETATIRIDSTGAITAAFGIASHGQGLETTLAQIIAEHLGARFEDIRVIQGDSAAVPGGTGTYASRSTVLAGGAARLASETLREKVVNVASHLLEARPAISSPTDGRITVVGHRPLGDVPRRRARGLFRDGARCRTRRARNSPRPRPTIRCSAPPPRRRISRRWRSIRRPIKCGIDRFVVAEDCGRMINPLIVDGQVHGGVAQGIGAALYEEIVYDAQGQLHTASLVDYLVPSACEIPPMDVVHIESAVADHARRLPRHGRRWHDRRAGRGRERGRGRAVAARHRDQRASRHARAPVPPDRGGTREQRKSERWIWD